MRLDRIGSFTLLGGITALLCACEDEFIGGPGLPPPPQDVSGSWFIEATGGYQYGLSRGGYGSLLPPETFVAVLHHDTTTQMVRWVYDSGWQVEAQFAHNTLSFDGPCAWTGGSQWNVSFTPDGTRLIGRLSEDSLGEWRLDGWKRGTSDTDPNAYFIDLIEESPKLRPGHLIRR